MPLPSDSDFDLSARQWSELEAALLAQRDTLRGVFGTGTGGNVEIASGVVTPTGPYVRLEAEGGVADTATSIDLSGFEDNALILIQPHGGEPEITIQHTAGTGGGKFNLQDGANFIMKGPQYALLLRKTSTDTATEVLRWYGVLDDGPEEFGAFLGVALADSHGSILWDSSGSWTAPISGDIVLTGTGGGGGGGGGSDGVANASAGGDGGDTTFAISGGATLATFPGGKGGGGGFASGRGGNPAGGSFGGQRGETNTIGVSIVAAGGESIPTSLGKYGRGGRGGNAANTSTGGGGASGGQTEEQTQVVTVTKGTVYTITRGTGGSLGAGGGSGNNGVAGEAGALRADW